MRNSASALGVGLAFGPADRSASRKSTVMGVAQLHNTRGNNGSGSEAYIRFDPWSLAREDHTGVRSQERGCGTLSPTTWSLHFCR
jgi:hypothetical protein